MNADPIVFVAALLVSGLLLTWLFQILKPTIITVLAIAAIALGLQLLFGISPETLSQQVAQLPEQLWELGKQFFSSNGIANLG